jgi:hypothetical protein
METVRLWMSQPAIVAPATMVLPEARRLLGSTAPPYACDGRRRQFDRHCDERRH